jgi:hypothetical protein
MLPRNCWKGYHKPIAAFSLTCCQVYNAALLQDSLAPAPVHPRNQKRIQIPNNGTLNVSSLFRWSVFNSSAKTIAKFPCLPRNCLATHPQ